MTVRSRDQVKGIFLHFVMQILKTKDIFTLISLRLYNGLLLYSIYSRLDQICHESLTCSK